MQSTVPGYLLDKGAIQIHRGETGFITNVIEDTVTNFARCKITVIPVYYSLLALSDEQVFFPKPA
jgi:hypothetical protein